MHDSKSLWLAQQIYNYWVPYSIVFDMKSTSLALSLSSDFTMGHSLATQYAQVIEMHSYECYKSIPSESLKSPSKMAVVSIIYLHMALGFERMENAMNSLYHYSLSPP